MLNELLKFDAFDAAEKITGKSYKSNKKTEALGIALHMTAGLKKEQALKEIGDSHYGIRIEDYIELIESIGFVNVFEKKIFREEHRDYSYEDTKYVFYDYDRGILLTCDSFGYSDKTVNSSNFFFEHFSSHRDCYSSGCIESKDCQPVYYNKDLNPVDYVPKDIRWILKEEWEDYKQRAKDRNVEISLIVERDELVKKWIGHNDGREAISNQIKKLDECGVFNTRHPEFDTSIIIYLCNHDEDKSNGIEWSDPESTGWKCFNSLPVEVKERLGWK